VLRHVALFRWKPEATAEDISKVEAALHQLPAKIPCIQSYRFGRDLGIQDGNADFALVADFSDRPILAQREAIQYVIDHSD
jgi:hypothetical protein